MKKRFLIVIVFAYLSVFSTQARTQKAKKAPDGVTVRLEIHNREKGGKVLRCVVINESDNPATTFRGYDQRHNVLSGQPVVKGKRNIKASSLYLRTPEKPIPVIIKKGEKAVLYEIPENWLFTSGKLDRAKRQLKEWSWDWPSRLPPPLTPFHGVSRDENSGYLYMEASFQSVVSINANPVVSDILILKLQLSVVEK